MLVELLKLVLILLALLAGLWILTRPLFRIFTFEAEFWKARVKMHMEEPQVPFPRKETRDKVG